MTQADLNDLATRIDVPGSFSTQSFGRLTNQIKSDFAARVDWNATYSGCDLDIYLHAFSYEPTSGYTGEIRTESQRRAAMNVKPDLAPPAGAAVVASRLALYAVLVDAGARTIAARRSRIRRRHSQNGFLWRGRIAGFAIGMGIS
jgi:hypothetical protein